MGGPVEPAGGSSAESDDGEPIEAEVVEEAAASLRPAQRVEGAPQPARRNGWPPGDRWPRLLVAEDAKSWLASLGLGVAIGLVISWFLFVIHLDNEAGSRADWFAGTGAFAAVAVALWQTNKIERQAAADAAQAAQRLEDELEAAKERSTRELEQARELHNVEMQAQREQSSIQRKHLLEQQQKQALSELGRAVNAYGFQLATMSVELVDALKLPVAQRPAALRAMSKDAGAAAQNCAHEADNAELITGDNKQLIEAIQNIRSTVDRSGSRSACATAL